VLPVFWLICIGWHDVQRKLQLDWHVPGNPGEHVQLRRGRSGDQQVVINAICVIGLSAYALACYFLHKQIMRRIVNPLFTPRTRLGHYAIAAVMYSIAMASSMYLTENWVAAAAGLFAFFGYGVCGRTVQATSSQRGQIGLGPSRAQEDDGLSFHVEGEKEESGADSSKGVRGFLLESLSVDGMDGGRRFASLLCTPKTFGDDAAVVEPLDGGNAFKYRGPCGRANIFRLDCLIVLLATFGFRLPLFLLGSGGYNQCVGITELLASLVYIPIGYTCFAVFGFRAGLANRHSMFIVLVLCQWPFINLFLGGKGCATLTDLISGKFMPEIWDSSAKELHFTRGFAHCTESAFALGGETLLVASTTIAAWVHVMSNFSFIFGFISGMLRMRTCRPKEEDIVVIT